MFLKKGNAILVFKVAIPFCIPTSNEGEFQLLHILTLDMVSLFTVSHFGGCVPKQAVLVHISLIEHF